MKTIAVYIAALGLLCGAVLRAEATLDGTDAPTRLAAKAHELETARARLLRRIDFAQSRIILAPAIHSTGAEPFDAEKFIDALHQVAGTGSLLEVADVARSARDHERRPRFDGAADEVEDANMQVFDFEQDAADRRCGVFRGQTELHDVEVRLHDVRVLVRDRGRYDPSLPDSASDAILLRTARLLLAGLGAVPEETSSFDLRTLLAGVRPEERDDAPPDPTARERIHTLALGKKVFFRRVLGDVEVAGDKMAFSFNRDGAFRKMRGRWTPVDYANSQLASPLSLQAFVRRAITTLLRHRVPPNSDTPIFLYTYFQPIAHPPTSTDPGAPTAPGTRLPANSDSEPCGRVRLDMRGLAIVEMHGPLPDSARLVQFDFDI